MFNRKISIIVPIYKVEKYLEKCVQSVLQQTYQNIEVILVDDGSTDKCPAICDKFSHNDERVIVVHKKNGGLVSARQAGVQIATGDYIGFVDGDDYIAENMIEKMVSEITDGSEDIIMCNYIESYGDEKFVIHEMVSPIGRVERDELYNFVKNRSLYGGTSIPHYKFGVEVVVWNKLFRADLLKRNIINIPKEISYGEDVACTIPALMMSKKIVVIDEPLYYYRINMESMSKAYSNCQTKNTIYLIHYLKNAFRLEKSMIEQLNYYHTSILMANIMNECRAASIEGFHYRYNSILEFIEDTEYKNVIKEIDKTKISGKTKIILNAVRYNLLLFPYIILTTIERRKTHNG